MTHNCYNCKHRGEVPGSAHSSCSTMQPQDSFVVAMYIQQRNGYTQNLKLNPHGMRNGWAFWPVDFDPVWVEQCNFYESSEAK